MPKKRTYPQQELAIRLREAMEESNVTLAELARECGVTIQAVYDWRITGRIGKQHLITIGRVTKKPLEYFLVGLGRAAAVALVALSLLLQPDQGHAEILHNSGRNTDCMRWRRLVQWLRQFGARIRREYFLV